MMEASVGKIIKNDYLAFVLAIGGPIALGISGFAFGLGMVPAWRGRGGQTVDEPFKAALCIAACVLTGLLFALLTRRIARIKRILRAGPRATAVIADVGFFKDRGRVEFEYEHAGRKHRSGTAIMKTRQTAAFAPGAKIEVAVDPRNPSKAFIVELYEAGV